jgi:hypothetical protein
VLHRVYRHIARAPGLMADMRGALDCRPQILFVCLAVSSLADELRRRLQVVPLEPSKEELLRKGSCSRSVDDKLGIDVQSIL